MKKFFVIVSLFFSFNAFACNDLLDTEMRILDSSETLNLCEYENNVILVVNVASRCGYTYQYASLQKLYERYRENDFVILGVPSRDFMQEYSSEEDVAEFCSTEYGVNFPMFATSKVRGKKASRLAFFPLTFEVANIGKFTPYSVEQNSATSSSLEYSCIKSLDGTPKITKSFSLYLSYNFCKEAY